MASQISVKDLREALNAADYPADKRALVDVAARAGAPDEVLAALRSLPPVEYRNFEEVARSVDTVEATGQSRAEAPAKARIRKRRLAEHLRARRR